MKRYRITLLVPHETTISAADSKAAEAEARRIINNARLDGDAPDPILHSVIYAGDVPDYPEDFFDPPPLAVA